MTTIRILEGDCRVVMATLPEHSVDAIVCDPPYELVANSGGPSAKGKDTPHGRSQAGATRGGFMGMKWDGTGVAFDIETWRQALRVLKPGGYLLAFGGTRTYHRMVCAIEDAGFEVRDQIGWLYGSGFPKSMDVAKAIDKAKGVKGTYGAPKSEAHAGWIDRGRMRGEEGQDGWQRPWMGDEAAVDAAARQYLPASEEAQQWQGWGTALKPAWEPIVVARKPLVGTVAANVLQHGTGALNIDGCRVPSEKPDTTRGASSKASSMAGPLGAQGRIVDDGMGRWPANIIHDGSDEVLAEFPQATGQKAPLSTDAASPKTATVYNARTRNDAPDPVRLDSGSAARFFYTAKASAHDRHDGLQHPGPQFKQGRMPHDAGEVMAERRGNFHPTVKPTDLMRYLVRLVTPPGGTVLDHFCGSGSTLKAAELEGFDAIGIELDPAHIDIARQRVGSDAPLFRDVQ